MILSLKVFFISSFLFYLGGLQQIVHLIPHSHCDAGYRESTLQYFVEKIKPILDNTIDYTFQNPNAKYIWVESIFLEMYWNQASDDKKKKLLSMVENKQWEIVMGGWTMNDQACVTFTSSIDQLTRGHTFLKEEIGVNARQGFSIDPFGASSVQTYLYDKIGYDYYIINRIPYELKEIMREKQTLQFLWSDGNGMKENEYLFTHCMYDHYSPPSKIPIKWWHGETPPISKETVDIVANLLLIELRKRSKSFINKDHLLFPYGDDFAYTDPQRIYGNMSYLINYINNHEEYSKEFHLQYSTLSDYFDYVKPKKNGNERNNYNDFSYPTVEGMDFFVYNSDDRRFWSGYYTSRPRLKLLSRVGEHLSRRCEWIYSLNWFYEYYSKRDMDVFFSKINKVREVNGEIQHHDAITGTCRDVASNYYFVEMEAAFYEANEISRGLLSSFVSQKMFLNNSKKAFLYYGDSFDRDLKYGDSIGMFVFNSLGWKRNDGFIEIPFISKEKEFEIIVNDIRGNVFPNEIIMNDGVVKKVIVDFGEVNAIGFNYFIFNFKKPQKSIVKKANPYPIISNDVYEIHFDTKTNKINKIVNKIRQITMNVKIDFKYYIGNSPMVHSSDSSDAYAFAPKDEDAKPKEFVEIAFTKKVIDNDLIVEVHQQYSDVIKVITRLYKSKNDDVNSFFEMEFKQIGELKNHQEVILTVKTEIQNEKVIFHDGLGLEMKKKEYFSYYPKKKVQANYYPTQYMSYITDDKVQFTVITSKSQGVSSQNDGEIEIMLHRRPSGDLGATVFPYIDDKYIIRKNFKMRFVLDTPEKSVDIRHKQTYLLNYPLSFYSFSNDHWNVKEYPDDFKDSFSFLKESVRIPKEIYLLSLNKISQKSDEFVLRLCNLYEKGEGGKEIKIDIQNLFVKNVTSIVETSLSLMKDLEGNNSNDDGTYTFEPLEIRTFRVKF